jgi:hypothetical protein
MSPLSWWWLSWVCAGVGVELYVVGFGQRSDRLSQNVWALQDSLPAPLFWRLLSGVLLLLLAWHLSLGSRH